jgi:lipoprotein-releasing system permease protein
MVIAMAVVSGYESTLRDTVINMQGHLMIVQRGGIHGDRSEIEGKVQAALPSMVAMTPFVVVEGLIIHNKKLSGIVLEGVDEESISLVQRLDLLVADGAFKLGSVADIPRAMIGKGIAKKFAIAVGDEFKLVIPVARSQSQEGFKPKMQKFLVSGIIDMGRTDYDERYVLTDIASAQKFGELGERISGWRVRLPTFENVEPLARELEHQLGLGFWARSWSETNRNLFQAVKYERVVIFIVVLILVIAAAFNVSSALFLNVVRRYSQIAIMKAMGVRKSFIRRLFTVQGLFVGLIGAVLGIILGLGGCAVFLWAERTWGLFPGEVYKLDFVQLEVRPLDMFLIVLCTMVVCFLATLAPARRGAELQPVEGLRYE